MKLMQILRKFHRNNKGSSLVEVLCVVAIMSIVGTSVCGMMVAGGNGYQRGMKEAELQEKSQLVINQINDLLIDSVSNVTFASNELTLTGPTKTYYIKLDGTDLKYSVDSETEILADHVTAFYADTSEFLSNGSVRVSLTLESPDASRTYTASFTITSRNSMISSSSGLNSAVLVVENEFVAEPGQTIALGAHTVGVPCNINYTISSTVASGTHMDTSGNLIVDKTETNSAISIVVKATDPTNGTVYDTKTVTVLVRRVNTLSLNATLSGTNQMNGAQYLIKAGYGGTNLDRIYGLSSDNDYVSPYEVNWTATMKINGSNVNVTPYLDVVTQSGSGAGGATYYCIKLKQNMPDNSEITITAEAKHPLGTNKTGTNYGSVKGEWKLKKTASAFTPSGNPIKRASDDSLGSFSKYNEIKDYMIGHGYGNGNYGAGKYHRYREIVSINPDGTYNFGAWTEWRPNPQNIADIDINLRPAVLSYDFNKGYEIQVAVTVEKDGYVVWPIPGVKPSGYSDYRSSSDPNPNYDYILDGIVEPVTVNFSLNSWGGSTFSKLGTPSAPHVVYANSGNRYEGILFYYANHTAYKEGELHNKLLYKIDEWNGGSWTNKGGMDENETTHGRVTQSGSWCSVSLEKGHTYRIRVTAKDIQCYRYEWGSYNIKDNQRFNLYNDLTGDGYMYVKVQ